jgi:hypothetical protein
MTPATAVVRNAGTNRRHPGGADDAWWYWCCQGVSLAAGQQVAIHGEGSNEGSGERQRHADPEDWVG